FFHVVHGQAGTQGRGFKREIFSVRPARAIDVSEVFEVGKVEPVLVVLPQQDVHAVDIGIGIFFVAVDVDEVVGGGGVGRGRAVPLPAVGTGEKRGFVPSTRVRIRRAHQGVAAGRGRDGGDV